MYVDKFQIFFECVHNERKLSAVLIDWNMFYFKSYICNEISQKNLAVMLEAFIFSS